MHFGLPMMLKNVEVGLLHCGSIQCLAWCTQLIGDSVFYGVVPTRLF